MTRARHSWERSETVHRPGSIPLDDPDHLVDRVRGHALSYMAERGEDDVVGDWMWRLAGLLEADFGRRAA